MRLSIAILFLIFSSLSSFSQYTEFDGSVRKVNVGLSMGLGGIHFLGKPALQVKFHGLSMKATYGWYYSGYDIQLELTEMNSLWLKSKLHSRKNMLVVSLQNNRQHSSPCQYEACSLHRWNDMYVGMIGIKSYQSSRTSISLKGGGALNRFTMSSELIKEFNGIEIFPYGEISYTWYLLK